MTAEPRDVAEVLAGHGWPAQGLKCRCGADLPNEHPVALDLHQVAMLAAEGYPVTAAGLAEVRAAAWDEGVRATLTGNRDADAYVERLVLPANPYRTEEGR